MTPTLWDMVCLAKCPEKLAADTYQPGTQGLPASRQGGEILLTQASCSEQVSWNLNNKP